MSAGGWRLRGGLLGTVARAHRSESATQPPATQPAAVCAPQQPANLFATSTGCAVPRAADGWSEQTAGASQTSFVPFPLALNMCGCAATRPQKRAKTATIVMGAIVGSAGPAAGGKGLGRVTHRHRPGRQPLVISPTAHGRRQLGSWAGLLEHGCVH